MTEPRHASALASVGLAAAALAASTPAPALVSYPGAAPCDGTLQACIEGVAAGETIEIVTATPILENLAIGKSLTLRSAAGVAGTLLTEDPGQGTMVLSDAAGAVAVRLADLRLVRTTVGILGLADGSHFEVVGCRFIDDGGDDYALDARLGAELSLLVERNRFEWTGPTMLLRTSGLDETDVVGVVVRANSMTSNTSDPILGPSASGVSVEVLGRAALELRFDSNLMVDLAAGDGSPAGLAVRQTFGDVLPTFPSPPVDAEILNNTLHDLSGGPALEIAGIPGGPIGSPPGSLAAFVYNNILSRNSAESIRVTEPLANVLFLNDYNDLFANGAPPVVAGGSLGPSTFDLDPLFFDEAGGDLRLSELSPLVDLGIDLVPLDPPFSPVTVGPIDVTGGPRVTGAAVDLGAFETFAGSESPVAIPTLDRLGLLSLALLLAAAAWRLRRRSGRTPLARASRTILALAVALAPAAASAQTGFVHVATSGNTFLHVTQIDHPSVNGNPSARLIVTPHWNPDSAPIGVDNPHPIGVFYGSNRWNILNEDLATLPLGAGFNVLVAPPSRSFVHEATSGNTTTSSTLLVGYQLIPLVATTRFLVTHNRTPDGQANGPLVEQPFRSRFFFSGADPRWSIELPIGETLPLGSEFNVYNPAEESAFHTLLHFTRPSNVDGEITELTHPALDGNPDALLWVYERIPFGPDEPNDHPIAVAYDVFDQVWVILNTDAAPYDENVRYVVGFLDEDLVFADGFEIGNTTEWSLRVP